MRTLNPTVQALFGLLIAYLVVLVISFSTFLQVPISPGEPLMWQAVVEQSVTWLLPVIALYVAFKVIVRNEHREEIVQESKLVLPFVFIILVTGMGVGVHASAQIIEEALAYNPQSFAYQLAFFIDEIVGHALLVPATFIGILFSILELNRKQSRMSQVDVFLATFIGIVNGLAWGLGSVEGGGMHVIVAPLGVLIHLYLKRQMERHDLQVVEYPYTSYFLTSTLTMVLFVMAWVLLVGISDQPSALGLSLFVL